MVLPLIPDADTAARAVNAPADFDFRTPPDEAADMLARLDLDLENPQDRMIHDEVMASVVLRRKQLADRTVDTYQQHWDLFCAWCAVRGLPPLPAEPITVRRFISWQTMNLYDGDELVRAGLSVSTIVNRVAAINRAHLASGDPAPGHDITVAETIKGVRREYAAAPAQKAALVADQLIQVIGTTLETPAEGLRDACLVLAARPQVRAAALARLAWPEVDIGADRVTLLVDDEPVHLQACDLPSVDPTEVFGLWRDRCGGTGAVFAALAGHSPTAALTSQQIGRKIRTWAKALGVAVPASGFPALPPARKAELVEVLLAPTGQLRDRSMLLSGWYTATRRSTITGWKIRHSRDEGKRGIRMVAERTKTDQDGNGSEWYLGDANPDPYNPALTHRLWVARHRRLLLPWCENMLSDEVALRRLRKNDRLAIPLRVELAEPEELWAWTPLYPALDRHGNLRADRHTDGDTVSQMIKTRVANLGWDPTEYGGHSLRAGWITHAAATGVSRHEIKAVSKHISERVDVYIRQATAHHNPSTRWTPLGT